MNNDYGPNPSDIKYLTSRLYSGLAWKYRVKHFLEMTERGKEFLWGLLVFLVMIASLSFFSAHFLLWLTGYYNTPTALLVVHH